MVSDQHQAEIAEKAHAKAEALREFAEQVCDRNAKYGLTGEARHFGTIYGNLARAEAAVAESVVELLSTPPGEGA